MQEALRIGAAYTGVEYLRALSDRAAVIAGMTAMFDSGVDLLASPTIAMTAPSVGATEVTLGSRPDLAARRHQRADRPGQRHRYAGAHRARRIRR